MPIGSKMNTHCMTINKQNPFLQKSCPTTMQTKKLLWTINGGGGLPTTPRKQFTIPKGVNGFMPFYMT